MKKVIIKNLVLLLMIVFGFFGFRQVVRAVEDEEIFSNFLFRSECIFIEKEDNCYGFSCNDECRYIDKSKGETFNSLYAFYAQRLKNIKAKKVRCDYHQACLDDIIEHYNAMLAEGKDKAIKLDNYSFFVKDGVEFTSSLDQVVGFGENFTDEIELKSQINLDDYSIADICQIIGFSGYKLFQNKNNVLLDVSRKEVNFDDNVSLVLQRHIDNNFVGNNELPHVFVYKLQPIYYCKVPQGLEKRTFLPEPLEINIKVNPNNCQSYDNELSCQKNEYCFWFNQSCSSKSEFTNCSILPKQLCGTDQGAVNCRWVDDLNKCMQSVGAQIYNSYQVDDSGLVPKESVSGSVRDINVILALILSILTKFFGIIGGLALLMFIYGGLRMVLAFGNEEEVKKAKDILIAATIGLLIIFSAYLIIDFLLDALQVKDIYRGLK